MNIFQVIFELGQSHVSNFLYDVLKAGIVLMQNTSRACFLSFYDLSFQCNNAVIVKADYSKSEFDYNNYCLDNILIKISKFFITGVVN